MSSFPLNSAKLAEWQASKGKTLKRPAMKIAETKVLERKQVKSHAEPDTQSKPRDFLKAQEVESPGPFLMPHKSVESQHMDDVSRNTLVFFSEDLLSLIVNKYIIFYVAFCKTLCSDGRHCGIPEEGRW